MQPLPQPLDLALEGVVGVDQHPRRHGHAQGYATTAAARRAAPDTWGARRDGRRYSKWAYWRTVGRY